MAESDPIPVLNKYRDEIPHGAVYIGRPGPWGNPYSHLDDSLAQWRVDSREEAVENYRFWQEQIVEADPSYYDELLDATALVCYCAPLSCHGDVIAEWIETRKAMLGRFEDMIEEIA